jgi:sodium-dependent dicarboxylate transporter 2/3/5
LLVYWISEAIPVGVTSLLPLVLFPLSGVLKASEVASNYFKVLIIELIFEIFDSILKDTASFFFGSITLAYAIQRVNLHRRVALFVLTKVGSSAKWFVFYN